MKALTLEAIKLREMCRKINHQIGSENSRLERHGVMSKVGKLKTSCQKCRDLVFE
jgi:hypothetical protein